MLTTRDCHLRRPWRNTRTKIKPYKQQRKKKNQSNCLRNLTAAIHTLIDFAAFVTSSEAEGSELSTTDVVVNAAYILAFVAYGLFMMRSAQRLWNDSPHKDPTPRIGPSTEHTA